MNKNFLNMLGLCSRAGKCVFGEAMCLSMIRSGKANLVLMDEDSSPNTKKRFQDACAHKNVKMLTFNRLHDASAAAGKPGRKLISISDQGFSKKLIGLYTQADSDTRTGEKEI